MPKFLSIIVALAITTHASALPLISKFECKVGDERWEVWYSIGNKTAAFKVCVDRCEIHLAELKVASLRFIAEDVITTRQLLIKGYDDRQADADAIVIRDGRRAETRITCKHDRGS